MAQLTITQTSPHRVHIQNLAFNCSKQAVLNVIENSTGLVVPLQVIRKTSGHQTGVCSGIFAVPTHSDVSRCISILNSLHPSLISNILAPGAVGLRAQEAYIPGARSISGLRAPHFTQQFQQSTSSAQPLNVPQQTEQLSSNQVQTTVWY